MELVLQACFLLLTYVVAAVPFGLVLTTLWGSDVDLREAGSGNIGATNVARTHGWRIAVPVLLLDAAKGAVPVLLASAMWPQAGIGWPSAVAVTAFIGHCWPIYLEFRGGKGVATAAGALLAMLPMPTALAAAIWGATLAATGRSSMASLIAATSLVVVTGVWSPDRIGVVLLIASGIALTHAPNIRRLMGGTETQVVRPVQWNHQPKLSAAEALAQGPGGQALDQQPWPTKGAPEGVRQTPTGT